MVLIRISVLLLIAILEQSIGQNIRALQMTIMHERQFQCISTTCLPYFTSILSDIRRCQFKCLEYIQCKAASFQQIHSTCQLFDNTITSSTTLDAAIDTVAMIVISETEISLGKYQKGILHSTA